MAVTPDASPSRPSVKFTPLTVPNTTINTKMINSQSGIANTVPPVKGITMDASIFATLK
jgi:hypothetical protein